jgi:L-cysteine:1D-myo-inositol 2-amino-2-deoxy-alpha-D-glucopyranoside ligase
MVKSIRAIQLASRTTKNRWSRRIARLYNALTREKKKSTPAQDHATKYVCGITTYDTTHLGHAFAYVVCDTPVRCAQNVTDIDDDNLRKANEVD